MSPQHRAPGIAIAAALVLFPAFCQTTSTTTNPSGNTTVPSASSTSGTTGATAPPRSAQQMRLSGRVMLDDGTAPPSLAIMERVCNGTPRSEGYTDGKGYFSIVLGQETEIIGDASEANSTHNSPLASAGGGAMGSGAGGGRQGMNNRFGNCELRARLGGYRSQSISLVNRSPYDNPDVGVILLHRLGPAEEAATVTATTLKAPKKARKALQKGLDLAKKNKPEEAIASLREAVRIDPDFAFAWCELGKLQAQNGRTEDAPESFAAAIRAEPRWPEPYMWLSQLAMKARNWKEVADNTGRVVRLDSFDYPQAFFFNALANFNLGHVDVAEQSALAAEKLDVQHRIPQIANLLGIILAENHKYAEAAERFRNYLMLAPDAADAPAARKHLDQMEKLAAESSQLARKEPQ